MLRSLKKSAKFTDGPLAAMLLAVCLTAARPQAAHAGWKDWCGWSALVGAAAYIGYECGVWVNTAPPAVRRWVGL